MALCRGRFLFMTLEDLIPKTGSAEVKEAITKIAEFLKSEEQSELSSISEAIKKFSETSTVFKESLDAMMKCQDKTNELLQQLLNKEDSEIEFPKVQKVVMEKPDWYAEPQEDDKLWVANLINSIRYEGDRTRAILKQILEKEVEEVEPEKEEVKPIKTVSTGSLRTRRTVVWRRFDNYDLKNITSAGDGITFYLPDSLIKDSEFVYLNGGSPLKNSDYTLTGNCLVFKNGDQSNSQIMVKGQVK